MFNNQNIINGVLVFDRQVQVYNYLGSFYMVDQTIIAHCGNKRNSIPMSKHTVTYMVSWLVANPFKIVCLIPHTTYYTGIAQKINKFGDTTFDDRKQDLYILWFACDRSLDSLLPASS